MSARGRRSAAGSGKTELLLAFLAEHPELRAAWIEDHFTIYPCALPQQGVQLDRILFVTGLSDSLWAAHQALRSQLFGVVILSALLKGKTDLRRLQLSAEQANASVVLLTETPTVQGAWPISLQINWKAEAV